MATVCVPVWSVETRRGLTRHVWCIIVCTRYGKKRNQPAWLNLFQRPYHAHRPCVRPWPWAIAPHSHWGGF